MGKKKGGQAKSPQNGDKGKAKKKGGDDDFDDLLAQLSQATEKNAGLSAGAAGKATKKDRKAKMQQLQDEKKERELQERRAQQQQVQQQQQIRQLMEFLQQQQNPYLEKPITEKESELSDAAGWKAAAVGMQGWRRGMEDAHILAPTDAKQPDGRSCFAVFDGHGGKDTAEFAAAQFGSVLQELRGEEAPSPECVPECAEWDDEQRRLAEAFIRLDARARDDEKAKQSGTTATVVVVVPEDRAIYCANAGDSRAVLCRGGRCEELSHDHKPTNDGEQARIEAAGGMVSEGRVDGNLAVSRGFGDFQYKDNQELPAHKQKVTAAPEVSKVPLDDGCEFVIVACDGIWDCMSSDKCVADVRQGIQAAAKDGVVTPDDLRDIAGRMMDSILSPAGNMLGSDNMTMIIATFPGARFETVRHADPAGTDAMGGGVD